MKISPRDSSILTVLAGYVDHRDPATDQEMLPLLSELETPIARQIGDCLLGQPSTIPPDDEVKRKAEEFKKGVLRLRHLAPRPSNVPGR